MMTPSTVLAGVDFSVGSEAALRCAARVARIRGVRLRVLHVIDRLVVTDLSEALPESFENLQKELCENTMVRLRALAETAGAPPETEFDVVVGTPLEAMHERVDATGADLVVLGVYGGSGPSLGAGTFASACTRKLPAKVLLVRGDVGASFSKIVAAVDFSETSKRAARAVASLAAHEGAQLSLLHVFYGPWHRLHYRAPTPEKNPRFKRQYLDALRLKIDSLRDEIAGAAPGLECKGELLEDSSYARGILRFSRDAEADLVVLGTRGRTNLRYVMLGSTAEKVLRELPCSVLTVKPE